MNNKLLKNNLLISYKIKNLYRIHNLRNKLNMYKKNVNKFILNNILNIITLTTN